MSHPRYSLESEVQFGKGERIMTALNQFDILDSYWEVVIVLKCTEGRSETVSLE